MERRISEFEGESGSGAPALLARDERDRRLAFSEHYSLSLVDCGGLRGSNDTDTVITHMKIWKETSTLIRRG